MKDDREMVDKRKRIILIIMYGLIGICIAIYGVMAYLHRNQPVMAEPEVGVRITITGAVYRPGLYALEGDVRVKDAILAAGGMQETADGTSVNLAKRVAEGETIDIPFQISGDEEPKDTMISTTLEPAAKTKKPTNLRPTKAPLVKYKPGDGLKINLNTASRQELQRLPGVGEATAEKIIAYRQENGLFKTVDQLKQVDGIGDRTIAGLREFVFVEPDEQYPNGQKNRNSDTVNEPPVETEMPDIPAAEKININLADIKTLCSLKGIGEVTAQRIIEYREQNGPFPSIEAIKEVKGIGEKKFEDIKDKITVGEQ